MKGNHNVNVLRCWCAINLCTEILHQWLQSGIILARSLCYIYKYPVESSEGKTLKDRKPFWLMSFKDQAITRSILVRKCHQFLYHQRSRAQKNTDHHLLCHMELVSRYLLVTIEVTAAAPSLLLRATGCRRSRWKNKGSGASRFSEEENLTRLFGIRRKSQPVKGWGTVN